MNQSYKTVTSPQTVRREQITCNLCGADNSRVLAEFVMYAPSSLVKCLNCGLLYVSPRLSREAMAFHFNAHYLQPSGALAWEQSRRPIYEQVLALIKKYQKDQVFDVGCSHGTFLLMCQRVGLTVGGCDISSEACRRASVRLGVKIFDGTIEEITNLIDPQECIVSIDTLYYCSDPQRHLTLIHSILKPGGVLVLRVRNGWYVELASRLSWRSFPIEHLYFFTPGTLGGLLENAGFSRWEIIPGVSHGMPRPVDVMIRSISGLATVISRKKWVPAKDFCAVAIKA